MTHPLGRGARRIHIRSDIVSGTQTGFRRPYIVRFGLTLNIPETPRVLSPKADLCYDEGPDVRKFVVANSLAAMKQSQAYSTAS
jgi:hypothetical protein